MVCCSGYGTFTLSDMVTFTGLDFVENDSFMSFVWLLNYDSPLNHKRFNSVSIRAAEKLILCRCKEPHSAFSVDHLSAFLFSAFEISGCEKTSSSVHSVLKP